MRLSQRGMQAKCDPVSSGQVGPVSRKRAVMVTRKLVPVYGLNSPATDPNNGTVSGADGYEILKTLGLGVFSTDLLRTSNA